MDRRVLLAGLFGVAGTAVLTAVLPPQAEALVGVPPPDLTPGSSVLPNLEDLKTDPDDSGEADEGLQLAQYYRRRRRRFYRRRRRRGWRWRHVCRRWRHHGHWRHRCYRRRFAIWIMI
ncbi:MAG: protamine-2 (modular protein) [Alphaproteobacteria bacterium]|nr:MAG: protamine-2 (modular protein) [Alphaproteobacteria bacterium]